MLGNNQKKQYWVNIAKARIINILGKYRVCTKRQFETKISEAGPINMRPEPIFIMQAINELKRKDTIVEQPGSDSPTFFTFPSFNQNKEDQKRYKKLQKLHKKYRKLAQKRDNCGDILEKVVYDSAIECKSFSIVGKPGHPPQNVNGYDFTKIGSPEFVLMYNSPNPSYNKPIKAIVECKNIRQWLYPDAHEIWEFLKKASLTGMIPILITRKIAYPTRYLFMSIGAMGFEMHRQYFAPHLKEEMRDITNKDELGFHNIVFSEDKETRLINFFDNVVGKQIETLQQKFISAKDLVLYHTEDLSDKKISPHKRKAIYNDVFKEIVRPEWKEEYKEHYPDDYL